MLRILNLNNSMGRWEACCRMLAAPLRPGKRWAWKARTTIVGLALTGRYVILRFAGSSNILMGGFPSAVGTIWPEAEPGLGSLPAGTCMFEMQAPFFCTFRKLF